MVRVGMQAALSGLRAAQARVDVASDNIANVNTEGYARRSVELRSAGDVATPAGSRVGAGVEVDDAVRVTSPAADGRLLSLTGEHAARQARADLAGQAELLTGEPDAGLTGALSAMWDAFEDVAVSPADSGARAVVVGAVDAVATRVNGTTAALDTLAADAAEQLELEVSATNQLLGELSDVNRAIGGSEGATANLADRRDLLLREVTDQLGGAGDVAADGTGRLVVAGREVAPASGAATLTVSAEGTQVALNGQPVDVGGTIGGMSGWLSDTFPQLRDSYVTVAADVADALNATHQAGFDTDGAPGGPLFDVVPAANEPLRALISDGDRFAAAQSPPAGLDGRNAQALADLRSAGHTDAVRGWLTSLGADVAAERRSAEVSQSLLSVAEQEQMAVSGVNLDEEVAALLDAQRAYESAARALTAQDQMLEVLVNRTGVVGR